MIGKTLNNQYLIVSQLGSGGQSNVYLAWDIVLEKQWAIKIIFDNSSLEFDILKQLSHPKIPRIVNHFKYCEYLVIVMDFINGKTLLDFLQDKAISEKELINIGMQLCEILNHLHQQRPPIIFRDMKPHNVLIDENGHVWLIDFGIARYYRIEQQFDTQPLGTIGFAPMEQFGEKQSTVRTDIYAMGMTLYFLAAKSIPMIPFERRFIWLKLKNRTIHYGTYKLLKKCVALNDVNRFSSVVEVQQKLQQLASRRKKIFTCITISIWMILVVLAIGLTQLESTKRQQYEQILIAAELTQNHAQFLKAIHLNPTKQEAYDKLIDHYIRDNFFEEREQLELMHLYQLYSDQIKGDYHFFYRLVRLLLIGSIINESQFLNRIYFVKIILNYQHLDLDNKEKKEFEALKYLITTYEELVDSNRFKTIISKEELFVFGQRATTYFQQSDDMMKIIITHIVMSVLSHAMPGLNAETLAIFKFLLNSMKDYFEKQVGNKQIVDRQKLFNDLQRTQKMIELLN